MYSRSYGLIEQEGKTRFSVPPDYNGNLYRKEEKEESPKESSMKAAPEPPHTEEKKAPPPPSGMAGGFLERLTAEDILLFVFLYSLLRGDSDDSGNILGLILALLLL